MSFSILQKLFVQKENYSSSVWIHIKIVPDNHKFQYVDNSKNDNYGMLPLVKRGHKIHQSVFKWNYGKSKEKSTRNAINFRKR